MKSRARHQDAGGVCCASQATAQKAMAKSLWLRHVSGSLGQGRDSVGALTCTEA